MKYPISESIIWQFDTAQFRVVCHVDAEDQDPADSFQYAEDVAFAREDDPAHWFCATVSVWFGEDETALTCVGSDHLGGCSYNSFSEFVSGHRSQDPANRNTLAMKARHAVICHYFPGMVAEAISQARKTVADWKSIPLRTIDMFTGKAG